MFWLHPFQEMLRDRIQRCAPPPPNHLPCLYSGPHHSMAANIFKQNLLTSVCLSFELQFNLCQGVP